jgi:hypothetical protein
MCSIVVKIQCGILGIRFSAGFGVLSTTRHGIVLSLFKAQSLTYVSRWVWDCKGQRGAIPAWPPEGEGGRRGRRFDLRIPDKGSRRLEHLPPHDTDHRVRVYVSERDASASAVILLLGK